MNPETVKLDKAIEGGMRGMSMGENRAFARRSIVFIAVVTLISVALLRIGPTLDQPVVPTRPDPMRSLIREEQPVLVTGVVEVWQLQWGTIPRPRCDIIDGNWPDSPCQGFVYGESGPLDIVRYRNGHEYDRLQLTPLFADYTQNEAIVQRWQEESDDLDAGIHPLNSPETLALIARIRARPTVKVMLLEDYDHDGNATEFFFQTEAEASHRYGVVVGISASNPRLHAFGSALHPGVPLVIQPHEWEALRRSDGPVRVMDWKCPDHGATTDTELELEATLEGMHVISREFADCGQEPRRLLHMEYR
jgi:hypothetical protein